VKEAVAVHEGESGEDLQQDDLYRVLWKVRVAVFDQLVEILLHVLEHEVKNVIFTNDLLELHYVSVGELLERLEEEKLQ
jgi:hypothetical protein